MQHAKVVAITPKRRHRYPEGLASVVVPNVLDRAFAANEPNQVGVGDLTYLHTTAGWMYLAVVVVGWALSRTADTKLTLAALNQALILRRIDPHSSLLFHSDQGCQYTSEAYQQRLKTMDITPSMSRRGNCWDNAVMERFFRSFKTETQHGLTLKTPDEITWITKKYIHFYNTQRIHSTNGYQAPNSFEQSAQKCA
jgi:putative transposase